MPLVIRIVSASAAMNIVRNMVSSFNITPIKCVKVGCVLTHSKYRNAVCMTQLSSHIHTTHIRLDLMEFFDSKDNWGATEIKVGRAWRKEELRIKSNVDLHKLWFVLLKEKNMLLTMEYEAKDKVKLFPTPERIEKVNESMENLEAVVRERNQAYFQLETGETGERPGMVVTNPLGLRHFHRMREYVMPKFMNRHWHARHFAGIHRGCAVRKFLNLYREKLFVEKKKEKNRQRNHVMQLLKRFPNIDMKALAEQYPSVNLQEAAHNKKARGHRVNTT